jgi:hypothetical protein
MHKPFFYSTKSYTPRDKIEYSISSRVIQDTETVLKQYGRKEGLVYWGATKEGLKMNITAVIAPKTTSGPGNVSVSHKSNFDFVGALSKYNLIQVAQVHSHPSQWVGHSLGDDEMAAFKTDGLLSIVVPEYCQKGMLPLTICGIHRFTAGEFKQLSTKYIQKHFQLTDNIKPIFEDQRK